LDSRHVSSIKPASLDHNGHIDSQRLSQT
jgi:hypothetical protein